MTADTIFALSSGRVPSAVAVVRISGPASRFCLETILAGPVPAPRRASLRRLVDADGAVLDQGLVLWLPGPGTFTGEDCAELQVHGSGAVVRALLRHLAEIDGLRPAEPGEFTRQAFLNGLLDLAEVEGLGDLIAAETEIQRKAALDQMRGGLGAAVERWRERLIAARAWIEAEIDFPDEGDVPQDIAARAWGDLAAIAGEIAAMLDTARPAERIRDGFEVALMGPPNAGKSTLLNALAGREVAIVHEEAGTTRDLVEVALDLAGYPVRLVDTAGVRDASGAVEGEGIARGLRRGAAADLVLWLTPTGAPADIPAELGDVPVVHVHSKSDLVAGRAAHAAAALAISAQTGAGLDVLVDDLRRRAKRCLAGRPDSLVLQQRQRTGLLRTRDMLQRVCAGSAPLELAAEDLRLAADELDSITGRRQPEALLDRVFGSFCIGK